MNDMTHMPFLVADVLLFCRANNAPTNGHSTVWKLWHQRNGVSRRIETGLADSVIECSPAAWFDGEWHVSFISGGSLYLMDGLDLDRMGEPRLIQKHTLGGFVHKAMVVYCVGHDTISIIEPSKALEIKLPGVCVLRISYRSDDPYVLLISANRTSPDDIFTITHDLRTGEQRVIECDGRPAYKCTMLGNRVLYAYRCGEHFEDRRIMEAAKMVQRPYVGAV
jgi:hypothetical protein